MVAAMLWANLIPLHSVPFPCFAVGGTGLEELNYLLKILASCKITLLDKESPYLTVNINCITYIYDR